MKIRRLLSLIIVSISLFSFKNDGSKVITWDDLISVAYRRTYSPQNEVFYDKPIFSKDISALNNIKVKITGYVIPIDSHGERYFLSATPNSSCFFCGKGEAHQVMELKLKNLPANYKMDEYLSFEGILRTHADPLSLPYSLENAILVKN